MRNTTDFTLIWIILLLVINMAIFINYNKRLTSIERQIVLIEGAMTDIVKEIYPHEKP